MQKRKGMACVLAMVCAAVLSVLRVLVMPQIAAGETGMLNTVLFGLSLAAVVLLWLFGGNQPASIRVKSGATAVSVGAIFLGVSLIVSSLVVFYNWSNSGRLPYPVGTNITGLSELFGGGMVLFGLLGGLFFLLVGVMWFLGNRVEGFVCWLSAAPLAWVWMRVCQFEISYYSSLPVFRQWYDLLLLIGEMVLFLHFARYVLHVGRPPCRLLGISLAVGVLAVMACVTRAVMALRGEQAAFNACGLLTVSDLGVVLFAFGFAFSYRVKDDKDDEPEEKPLPVEVRDETPFLLADFETANTVEEEPTAPPVAREPLELEDVLMDIFRNMDNGQN